MGVSSQRLRLLRMAIIPAHEYAKDSPEGCCNKGFILSLPHLLIWGSATNLLTPSLSLAMNSPHLSKARLFRLY